MSVSIITTDHVGIVARDESLKALGLSEWFYLTSCCHAAVTGVSVTTDNPAGIACKGCYRPADPALAGDPIKSRGGCNVAVERSNSTRYPFQALCGCGWVSNTYLTAAAAGIMADAHVAG